MIHSLAMKNRVCFVFPADQALINRLGFNNQGTPNVIDRLKKVDRTCVVGINIGKNKSVPNEEAVENYLKSFELAYEVADYIAVNVSSPNTPSLRELQKAASLELLLGTLQKRNAELGKGISKPLFVKIAPDLNANEIESIVEIVLSHKVSGIIATNTTIDRSGLNTPAEEVERIGAGGLSGGPLADRSNEVIRKIYKHSEGKLPIIGVGGVFTADDALKKITAGACLIQAYTGFVYKGLGFARAINTGLAKLVKEKGCKTIDELIGADFSG